MIRSRILTLLLASLGFAFLFTACQKDEKPVVATTQDMADDSDSSDLDMANFIFEVVGITNATQAGDKITLATLQTAYPNIMASKHIDANKDTLYTFATSLKDSCFAVHIGSTHTYFRAAKDIRAMEQQEFINVEIPVSYTYQDNKSIPRGYFFTELASALQTAQYPYTAAKPALASTDRDARF